MEGLQINHNIQVTNKSSETAIKYTHIMTVTNKNYVHKDIKSRKHSGNAC